TGSGTIEPSPPDATKPPAPANPPSSVFPPPTASPSPTTAVPPAPAADVAQRVALDVLTKAGVVTSSKDWTITVADSGGVAVACTIGTPCPGPAPSQVTARTVAFMRVIDGVTLRTPLWSVMVTAGPTIAAVSGQVGDPERAGDVTVRSASALYDDLVHGRAVFAGPQPLGIEMARGAPSIASDLPLRTTVVTVTGATRGLVLWPTIDGRRDVVPTVRFATRDESGNAGEIEVLAVPSTAFGTPTSVGTRPPPGVAPQTAIGKPSN
ncbi:MAG TPA: hypothetical protein VFR41_14920, partial [Acidimicrobiia bacterium]|nr:hypothetical protein [Acidimicrobiia bacterium]